MAVYRPPQQRDRRSSLWITVPSLFVVTIAAAVWFLVDLEPAQELDADLCPVSPSDIAHRAALLFDLHKPTTVAQATGGSLAGDALRSIVAELGAGTELTVFATSSDRVAPAQRLARLCKPYDSAAPATGEAGVPQDDPDCAGPMAHLAERDLEYARRFCARRDSLRIRIDGLMAQSSLPVQNAFVIEAIEEVSFELTAMPGRKSLYVFSDMLAHTDWYSHFELGWDGWNFTDYVAAREKQDAQIGPRPQAVADLAATLYYVPREGVTDTTRPRAVHQQFWHDYFADATAGVPRFVDLPITRSYSVATPEKRPSIVETARVERQRLQREREAAERQLAQLSQARAELERLQQPAPEQGEQQEARQEVEQEAEDASPSSNVAAVADAEPTAPALQTATPPEQMDVPTEAGVPAESAADAVAATDIADVASCDARLLPRFALLAPAYPGRYRVNYGSATVTLSYVVDDQGETLDESVEVIEGASSATRPTFFDLFADDAVRIVERYRYEFDDPSNGVCEKRQRLTRQFVYRYDR